MLLTVTRTFPAIFGLLVTGQAAANSVDPAASNFEQAGTATLGSGAVTGADTGTDTGANAGVEAKPVPPVLPEGIAAMLRKADESAPENLDTVAGVARSTYPEYSKPIDDLVNKLKQAREERRRLRLSQQSLLEGWTGSIEAGLSYTTGNTNESGYLLQLQTQRDGLATQHRVNALLDRQSRDGDLTRARSLANYQIDRKFGDSLSAYGLFGWERDRFAGYTRRFTQSLGVGYRVIDSPSMRLSINAGPAFRQTAFEDGTSENAVAARGSLAYNWTILPRVVFSEDASVVVDGGSTFTSNTSLTTKLIGALSARLSYYVIHEQDPLPGRQKTDTTSRLSLVYSY